jgi:hypothetical protein
MEVSARRMPADVTATGNFVHLRLQQIRQLWIDLKCEQFVGCRPVLSEWRSERHLMKTTLQTNLNRRSVSGTSRQRGKLKPLVIS